MEFLFRKKIVKSSLMVALLLSVACDGTSQTGASMAVAASTPASTPPSAEVMHQYRWLTTYDTENTIVARIAPPEGYVRVALNDKSFGSWLRYLPLKPGQPKVYLYNGVPKQNQSAQYAVLDIDTGKEDLQQCADAIMRLKAEFHYSRKEYSSIHFRFTSGDDARYAKWIEGYRPKVTGNKVEWLKTASKDTSYKSFKSYLRQVFMYAGTSSLSKEMNTIAVSELRPGDVFIRGGFPGHAVLVMDVAENPQTGKRVFLLAQSYMPAQDIHILKNPSKPGSPWYSLDFGATLETPEWDFDATQLKRFQP
jgi:hypothetical protein